MSTTTITPSAIKKGIRFVNAQKMHEKHRKSFQKLPQKTLDNIKLGDTVKISAYGERFWVEVIHIHKTKSYETTGNRFVGRVDNELFTPKIKFNDLVRFRSYHIYNVY